MFVVNGSNEMGVHTSEHASMEEALDKAAEFMSAGMLYVTILDLEKKLFTEADIDLLIEVMKAEQHPGEPKP